MKFLFIAATLISAETLQAVVRANGVDEKAQDAELVVNGASLAEEYVRADQAEAMDAMIWKRKFRCLTNACCQQITTTAGCYVIRGCTLSKKRDGKDAWFIGDAKDGCVHRNPKTSCVKTIENYENVPVGDPGCCRSLESDYDNEVSCRAVVGCTWQQKDDEDGSCLPTSAALHHRIERQSDGTAKDVYWQEADGVHLAHVHELPEHLRPAPRPSVGESSTVVGPAEPTRPSGSQTIRPPEPQPQPDPVAVVRCDDGAEVPEGEDPEAWCKAHGHELCSDGKSVPKGKDKATWCNLDNLEESGEAQAPTNLPYNGDAATFLKETAWQRKCDDGTPVPAGEARNSWCRAKLMAEVAKREAEARREERERRQMEAEDRAPHVDEDIAPDPPPLAACELLGWYEWQSATHECWELEKVDGPKGPKLEPKQRALPQCCPVGQCDAEVGKFKPPFEKKESTKRCHEDQNGNGVGDGFAPDACCECAADTPYQWSTADMSDSRKKCKTDRNRNGIGDRFADHPCCVEPAHVDETVEAELEAESSTERLDTEPERCSHADAASGKVLEGVCVTSDECTALDPDLRQAGGCTGGKICCIEPEGPVDPRGRDPRQQMVFSTGNGERYKGPSLFHVGKPMGMVFTTGSGELYKGRKVVSVKESGHTFGVHITESKKQAAPEGFVGWCGASAVANACQPCNDATDCGGSGALPLHSTCQNPKHKDCD